MYIQEAFIYPRYSDDNKNGCREVSVYIYHLRLLNRLLNCHIFCFTFQKIIKLSVALVAISSIHSGIMIGITLSPSILNFGTKKFDGSDFDTNHVLFIWEAGTKEY